MTVAIISGAEGVGKTSQLLGVAMELPPVAFGILELKDAERIMMLENSTFKPTCLYKTYPIGTELQGNEDPVKTLEAVRQWRDSIYAQNPLPRTIVLDGISNIRDYAVQEWILKDNIARGKHRVSIGEKNLSAWADVNSAVREILKPLINLALSNHINLFMSAQMKEKYMNGEVVGYAPDYKPYMSYSVQCLLELSYSGDKYNISCKKDPLNPRWAVEGIKNKTGLLNALRAHNLVEAAPITYMIVYDEGGETKRAFIKAKTPEEAKKEFSEQIPEGNVIEVSK